MEEKGAKRMPIIALTANALKGEAEHCRAVGMDDYRSKPSPLTELKSALDKWLPIALAGADPYTSAGMSPTSGLPGAAGVAVDVNILKELVGDDPDLIRGFLRDFRTSAGEIMTELRAACANGQAKAAGAAAHKLKSSARAVGASALGELCEAVEVSGTTGDCDALSVLLPRLEGEWVIVNKYLEWL